MNKLIASFVISFLCFVSVANAQQYVKLSDDLTINYEKTGSGDTTLIFIPGWMMSTKAFVRQLAYFKNSTKYTALAYDPRGQGLSSKTVEGHTYQQHGRDLAALIEKLDLKNVILVGWSYGVTTQLSYLNQFGRDKIKAMIMIDTGPDITGASHEEWVWYLNDDSDGYARYYTEGIIEKRQTIINEYVKWLLEKPTPEKITFLSNIANMTSSTVAAIQNATAFYLDYSKDLIAVEGKVPLLYVVREESKAVADKWIKANTPSATAAYLGKHMMFWERPEEFNKIVSSFLATLD